MLLYNEDWLHFIWTRYEAGVEITTERLRDYIETFRGTQVTDFVMNVNGTVSTAPSRVFETFADKYMAKTENGILVDYTQTFAANAYQLICEKKIDMYQVWTKVLKEVGIRPWISIRVNDCHGNMEETDLRKSSYVDRHPEQFLSSHREAVGYFDKCMDYSREAVRERMLSYISEMLERYEIYGLELDLMRDFIFTRPGYEAEMKIFLDGVCDILDRYEEKNGRKIHLAFLVSSDPAFCLERGVNVLDYTKWLEYITIISRWETTDTDMPIELWKQILRGTDIQLGVGQQLLVKPYRGYKPTVTSVKMAFGQAMANLCRGSDFVYLYNYMDYGMFEGAIAEWVYEDSIRNDENRPLLFHNIGKIETLLEQDRSHVVTYPDFTGYYHASNPRLPIAFSKQSGYELIRIPVGRLPENAKITLLLGIRSDETIPASELEVYVNSAKCTFEKIEKINDRIYENDCYAFAVEQNAAQIMYAEVRIRQECTLEYVEISVERL